MQDFSVGPLARASTVHMYCDVSCATIVCPISNAVLRFLLAKIPFILFSFLYEKLVHKPLGNYIC